RSRTRAAPHARSASAPGTRRRSRGALEAQEVARPGEPGAHTDDRDVGVRRPIVPPHRQDRSGARAGGVAVPLDVAVVVVLRNAALPADRLEHAPVRLVAHEVEAAALLDMGAPELAQELRGLLDGEHLDHAAVLLEVTGARHDDPVGAVRTGRD